MDQSKSWHDLSIQQVLSELETTPSGLTDAQAKERSIKYGLNRLPQPPKQSLLLRFILQFHNILIYVLLVAALITALLGHYIDTSVILAVVLVNAIIGVLQEGKAEKAMDSIRNMLAPHARVLRNEQRKTVDAQELVPGDIVLLEAGDKVPADLRLIESHNLHIQEAILTGESIAMEKNTNPVSKDSPLANRTCIAFSGTTVTSGQGYGIVIATGENTEIGRISNMLSTVETLSTPLVEQMNIFAKWLTLFILGIALLILAFGHWVLHHNFTDLFMAVVGLSVAAIPEGLPAVLTITLAVGVQAMAKRNAIIRRLPAIETIGSVSVICTDKTGTLTRNEMSVVSVITEKSFLQVDGVGYAPVGSIKKSKQIIDAKQTPVVLKMAYTALLCNDAQLRNSDNEWSVEGDPMEGALLSFAAKAGLDIEEVRKQWTRTDLIPFDAKHKFMATLNHDHNNHAFIFVKGAPEAVLELCTEQYSDNDEAIPINKTYWHEEAEKIAAQGQRVLAFATRPTTPGHTVLEYNDLKGKLILLGVVGFIDPPRPEAITAVAQCHQAGIGVKMITGDHATTAADIAKQVGLINPDKVLTGADLDKFDELTLKKTVLQSNVFARTSPEHKLRLVKALQTHGMTVAMTGDGVNDAPALKRADAGIAMGLSGTEAAKEAAELVLADDNFASIVAAVREGRTVYNNIKKVISWTLPTNAGEAATILLALLLNMSLPVTPIQILWVNMITSVTLGISLAFEPSEKSIMSLPPRPRHQPLLTRGLLWHIIFVATLFLVGVFGMYDYAVTRGYSIDLARTIAMNTLVVIEIFHLFFIRNMHRKKLTFQTVRGTKAVFIAVITVIIAQLSITYIPLFQKVFHTVSMPLFDLLIIVSVGFVFFLLTEIEKQVRLRI